MERLHLSGKWAGLCALLMLGGVFTTFAQDPVTTQLHATRNYLNPAYAGYSSDLSLHYNSRLQWTNVSGKFATHNFAANIACEERNLGFALYAHDNREGDGSLRTTLVGGQIAGYFPLSFENLKKSSAPGMFSIGLLWVQPLFTW